MKNNIVIIGGGAAGLVAAIQAARQGARVTILEHMDRVGKKILSTGNGKCNLANRYLDEQCYRSEQKEFPYEVLKQFGTKESIAFFEGLGIYLKDKNGYLYPNSEQAASVLDVLRLEIAQLGVKVICGCQIVRVEKKLNPRREFVITTSEGNILADAIILAAGSKAAPVTGSDGSGYELARKLGHHIIKPLPALVQLRCEESYYKQLAGIRTEARVEVFADGISLAKDLGELQLTDYGISGIPVFQVSRYAAKALEQKKRVTVKVNYMPLLTEAETGNLLLERFSALYGRNSEECMVGLLNRKLSVVLLKLAGIPLDMPGEQVKRQKLMQLAMQISSMETVVTATNPFANAQVCCGGIDTREIDAATMESRLVKGLYLAGEIVDVDGICGGYNLQWAWSSGSIAGIHAGRGNYDKN